MKDKNLFRRFGRWWHDWDDFRTERLRMAAGIWLVLLGLALALFSWLTFEAPSMPGILLGVFLALTGIVLTLKADRRGW